MACLFNDDPKRAMRPFAADREGFIPAHGSATLVLERLEHAMGSTKSMVGHMMGATGAVEAVACVMTLNERIIYPTINYETPDSECDLDYAPNEAREAGVNIALSNPVGLGGQNACLVLGRVTA